MPYLYHTDSYLLMLIFPAMIFAIIAQIKVKSSFKKYSKVGSRRGNTASMIARRMLDKNGLQNIRIDYIGGSLTDYFDPKGQVIRLSETVYNSTSVAAIGIAAHEVGHAIQHSQEYMPIKIRLAIIPVTSFASKAAMPLVLIGIIFSIPFLVSAGIILFAAVAFFQLVTLPIEFNASSRAVEILENYMILDTDELPGAKKVLTAAALTYVAGLLVSLASLLRLILLSNRRR